VNMLCACRQTVPGDPYGRMWPSSPFPVMAGPPAVRSAGAGSGRSRAVVGGHSAAGGGGRR
jgi:hypothetical protein